MAKLVALVSIQAQAGFRVYQPGDTLPADDPAQAEEWTRCGAAVWQDDDHTPATWAKAQQAAADPGLPGLAVGGEATGNDLAGRVPMTHERSRRHGHL